MSSKRRQSLEHGLLAAVVIFTTWWLWGAHGTSDVDIWLDWTNRVLAEGPRQGYASIAGDYPPGASLLLGTAASLLNPLGVAPRFIVKVLLFLFLLATTALLLVASRRAVLTAFAHLAVVTSALGLMYLDILIAPFLVAAVWAAERRRHALMLGFVAGACLMKWQPTLVAPFAVLHCLQQRHVMSADAWKAMVRRSVAVPAAIAVVVLVVYGFPVLESFYRAQRHGNMSSYAANAPWVLTWWLGRHSPERQASGGIVEIVSASRPMLRVLALLTLVAYFWVARAYWRSRDYSVAAWLRHALVGYFAYFLLAAGVHENHLFLGALVAIALAWADPRYWWVAAVVAVSANLNMIAFYGFDGPPTARGTLGDVDITVWFALVNCVVLAFIARRLLAPERSSSERTLTT